MSLKLLAELGLDGSGFEAGIRRAEGQARKFSGETLGELKGQLASAFTVGAVIEFGKRIGENITRIKDMSEQFHLTTDQVQLIDIAAKKSGQSVEDIGKALEHLAKAREAALGGDDKTMASFGKLGISRSALQDAGDIFDLFTRITDLATQHPIVSDDEVASMDVLGKKGSRLLTIMQDLKKLGPVQIIDEGQIEKLDASEKKMAEAKRNLERVLAPAVSFAYNDIARQLSFPSDMGQLIGALNPRNLLGGAMNAAMGRGAPPATPNPTNSYSARAEVDLYKDAAEAKKIEAEATAEAAHRAYELMTVEQKRAALVEKIAKAKKEEIEETFQGNDVEAAKKHLQREQLQTQLSVLNKEPGSRSMEGDSLTRVGNFLGTSQSLISQIGERTNQLLTSIDATLRGMATRTIASSGDGGFPPTV